MVVKRKILLDILFILLLFVGLERIQPDVASASIMLLLTKLLQGAREYTYLGDRRVCFIPI